MRLPQCLLLAVAATLWTAHAADLNSSTEELIGFDKRRERRAAPSAEQKQAHENLRKRVPNATVDFDRHLGSPRWIRAEKEHLTGAQGQGKAVSLDAAKRFQNDPHQPVKAFVDEHRTLFGHGPEELDGAIKTRDYVGEHNHVRTTVWHQRVDDIPVYEAIFAAHVNQRGELIDITSQFVPGANRAANRGTPNRAAHVKSPKNSARRALEIAVSTIGEMAEDYAALTPKPEGVEQVQSFRIKPLPGEATVRLIWFPLDRDTLRLAWQVELNRRQFSERFRVLVDVQNGEVLLWRKLTVDIGAVNYRVYTNDSPTYMRPGWPTPNAAQPAVVPQSLVSIAALSTNASPLGWINDGEVLLRGNNVNAALDRDFDDRPDLPRAVATVDGSGNRTFDYPVNPAAHPTNYSAGASVQLFYWCNWMHDRLYDIGFTESAGNYQKDNFGRGGAGNDPVLADAQDGSGVNNANFTPSQDGQPARIQMYLFSAPNPQRDGDLDAEVILHEYTHGMSDRRVGNGAQISQLVTWGMAEGWSDFFAEAMLTRYEHDLDGNYPMGGYASYLFSGVQESYYYGIRRYPYSTSTNINPLRFSDIDPQQASTYPGIPRNPAVNGAPSAVHRIGEVWCTMLWDVRAAMLRNMNVTADTYQAANDLVMQIVADGMENTPANPTFTQARKGILMAEQQNTNTLGTNALVIWKAFARRGLGYSAFDSDSSTTIGIIAAYDVPPPPTLAVTPDVLTFNGIVGSNFSPSTASFTLQNESDSALLWSASSTMPFRMEPTNGTLPAKAATFVTVSNDAMSALPVGEHVFSVIFSNSASTTAVTRTVSVLVSPPADVLEVTPESTFLISGPLGGPFVPNSQTYTLQAAAPLTWSVSNVPPWLTFSQTNGTLAAGQVTNLTAALNANATAFPGGVTDATLYFINHSTGAKLERLVTVRVGIDDYVTENFSTRLFDLENTTLTLTPSGNGYSACLAVVTNFPTDPSTATTISGLGDDEYRFITLNPNPVSITDFKTVRLFGQYYSTLWIGANGNVTPNPGTLTNGFYPGLDEYFSSVRIAPLYVDLNPQQGGRVSWQQFSNRLVVTWENVPEFAKVNVNSCQVELFFDGVVQMTWLRVDAPNVISGVSRGGGMPPNFEQSDLSALPSCAYGARIAAPLFAREGDGVVTGTILLSGAPTTNLTVTLTASSPDIQVPAVVTIPAITTSYSFPITIVDDTFLDGSQTATIVATFPDRPDAVAHIVVHDNESTRVTVAGPVDVNEGSGTIVDEAFVLLAAPVDRDTTIQLTSSNTARILLPSSVTVPAGSRVASFDVTVVDDNILNGVAEDVVIAASVTGWPVDRDVITVHDNDPYELRISMLPFVTENQGNVPNAGWVSLPMPATFNVPVTLNSDQAGTIFPAPQLTIPAGSLSNAFTLFVVNNSSLNSFTNARITASSAGFLTATGLIAVLDDEVPTAPFGPTPADGATLVSSSNTFSWAVTPIPQPGTVTYSVFLGSNDVAGGLSLIGQTTNTSFTPSFQLESGRTYHWRVEARRGSLSASSPVWSFTTAPVDHFTLSTVESPRIVGEPFVLAITARDRFSNVVSSYTGAVTLTNFAPTKPKSKIVITEVDSGDSDRIEFQNVSEQPVSLSGWQVTLYDALSWPAPKITYTFPSPSVSKASEVFWLRAFAARFAPGVYPNFVVGTNLFWNSNPTNNPIAVLLRDNTGGLIDFFCAVDAFPNQITSPVPVPPGEWQGSPVPVNLTPGLTYQRQGNIDRNRPNDWVYQQGSILATNVGLVVPFIDFFYANMVASPFTNFANGVCTGTVTVLDEAHSMFLMATNSAGLGGTGNPFDVLAINDISVWAVAPDAVVVNDPFVVSIFVTNRGPDMATDVVVSNVLPSAASFISATSSQGSCSLIGRTVVCAVGHVLPDASVAISLTIAATAPVAITNVVTVTRGEPDNYLLNNSAVAITAAGLPQIAISDRNAIEPSTMTFNVRLTTPNAATVSVQYATSDGMATAGVDYLPTNGTLVFPPGVTNQVVSVDTLPDVLSESNETFFVVLSGAVNGQVIDEFGVGTIVDNDINPVLSMSDLLVNEASAGTNDVTFSLTLSAASGKTITVGYETINGTALGGFDYVPTYGTLVFPPGVTSHTVTVRVISHDVFKPNRTFYLSLPLASEVSLARSQAACTVLDKDTNRLHHLAFEVVPSKAFTDVPFTISGTGRDAVGALVTNFTGPVHLLAAENESVRSVGSNAVPWEFPLGAGFHDSRLQVIYLATDLGTTGQITSLALDVTNAPGLTLSNFTIRTKPFGGFFPNIRWESDEWMTNFHADVTITSTGWVTFAFHTPCRIDTATNVLVDFSFNNSSYGTEGFCRSTVASGLRSLGFRTDGGFGNPLTWSNATPAPAVFNRVPNTRFTIGGTVPVTPPVIATVTNGVFTAAVALGAAGSNVTLRAVDDAGHFAVYSGFQTIFDGDGDGMPDWWELANNLDRGDASDGALDLDGDGFTNLQEYLAGTDPRASSSYVRILNVQRPLPDRVVVTIDSTATRQYQLETSATLPATWAPVGTPTPGTGGSLQLLHRPATNDITRYYRVRVSP